MDRLQSIGATAEILGVSKDTVRRLLNSGALRGVRVSRRILVPESEISRVCSHGCKATPTAGTTSEKDGGQP